MVEVKKVIYWTFYAIYLLWVLGVIDTIMNNIDQETIQWIIGFIIIITLFTVCLLYVANTSGYNTWLSKTSIIYIGILVALCGVGFLSYKCYQDYHAYDKISQKIRNNLKPFGLHPIRNSDEISRRLGVVNDTIFPLNNSRSFTQTWELLMNDSFHIKHIVKEILGFESNENIDFHHNLFWYLCNSNDPFGNNLRPRDIRLLMSFKQTQLLNLFGPNYNGLNDKASLIFTALSGQVIPQLNYSPKRYQEISTYQPKIIYNLAYGQVFNESLTFEDLQYSPYQYLASHDKLNVEHLIESIELEDCDKIIEEFGLFSEGWDQQNLSLNQKYDFVITELSNYHQVINRKKSLKSPPNLINLDLLEIQKIAQNYTNRELIDAYDPRGCWASRHDLIRLIYDDLTGNPKWAFSNSFCSNDHTINILTGELHKEINKNDISDPILSYGSHKNYKCYQVSELTAAFREYDGIFMFQIPDWDPTDRSPENIREFPLNSIKKLQNFLLVNIGISFKNNNIKDLFEVIKKGLEYFNSAQRKTQLLIREYKDFSVDQQRTLKIYFSWMFMYSMWMRFWKGPGFAWPLSKVNVNNKKSRTKEQRTSPQERDENIFIQESVRSLIIESYEKDLQLKQWIEDLPVVYYDFETKESKFGSYPIKEILDKIALGDYCMGFGSDTILKTSYYYILHLLDISEGQSFDNFINEMLPLILDLEYQTVTSQLDSLDTMSTYRAQILNLRHQALQQPIPHQPGFTHDHYENNIHIDN